MQSRSKNILHNMTNNRTIAFAILFFIIFSCKREKLSDDFSYLYGKWTWIHTYKNLDQPGFADITPSSDENNYSIEITNKCVTFFKNEKAVEKRKYKDISTSPIINDTSKVTFYLQLSKKNNLNLVYYPNRSYILILEFPYEYALTNEINSIAGDGITYSNYFKK